MARRGRGEGSIFKRGSTWAYLLPRNLVAPGSRGYAGGFATRKQAQDELRKAITAAEKGLFVKAAPDTLQAYTEDVFLPKERSQHRASTASSYEQLLRTHVLPHLGEMRLQAITPVHLQQLWTALLSGTAGRRAVSARTVRMVYTVVRKLFADAEAQQLVARNPAPASNPPSRKQTEPPPIATWTREQIHRFLEHVRNAEAATLDEPLPSGRTKVCRSCARKLPVEAFPSEPKGTDGFKPDCRECYSQRRVARGKGERRRGAAPRYSDDPLFPLLLLASRSGMRRGELCGLRWADVDLEQGIIHVRQQYVSDGAGQWGMSEPKTQRSRRSFPIDHETAATLRAHRARQNQRRLALGVLYDTAADLVFARADGRPLNPERLLKRFKQLAVDAGLPPMKFHGLRHSLATIASERDVAATSAMLGHHDPAFTIRQYVHTDLDRMRRLVDGAAG